MAFRSRFITDYLNPLQAEEQVLEMVIRFPDLCWLETLPHLTHGYQGQRVEARGRQAVKVLHITAPGAPGLRPGVLLMRSHHAREWINAVAVLETAWQLLDNYRPDDADPRVRRIVETLDRVEYFIIYESNPDGARLSFFDEGRRMWRKNLRPPTGGCAGVDCNRNFPRYWGEAGSSPATCSETYRGPEPLSEPEAANIADLVQRDRRIVFAIDSHSHGQSIFRPSLSGGQFTTSEPVTPEDEAIYRHLESAMNESIGTVQGIQYSTGSTSNHAGTTDEFLFFDHHVFGFDLECGLDFQPPASDAVLASLEVAEASKALGWCAAGGTGLDIAALVQRRLDMDTADFLAGPHEMPILGSWEVSRPAPEQHRRYLLSVYPLKASGILYEYQYLIDNGFDVELNYRTGYFDIVSSEADQKALLQLGYQPTIVRDLLAE